jgi:adenosine deaminase CECR1
VKLIYSGHRRASATDVWTQLKQAVELRKAWTDRNFILGFDLVGEEDAGHTTEYFLPDWVKLRSHLAEQKTTLPFFFHDGESDWPSDENLYDAFLLGSRRIGHGFNLFRFPTLQKQVKSHQVAVEVCPISNQQLRYVSDLRMHPASGYLNQGIACVIGSDDPGIFGNEGLSFDFWEAVVAWDLDLRSLKQLALNSLLYSGMTELEKSAAIAHWQASWDDWVSRSSKSLR